ncbi:M23 family metallopeptidase [Sphingomonas sp.]|uniref:M23 family metallopeptidase n=1 Tax=Sphingomonas sp. TaxID=28214 RepID=UPI001B0035FF|nr:M23 family metallopeptidase [Sphingomonas sp.]MBO9713134.1 M23 family metallopeptidase [Sphingomonas sp.]
MSLVLRASLGALAVVMLGTAVAPSLGQGPQAAPRQAQQRTASGFSFTGPMIQGGMVIGTAPRGTGMVAFNGASIPITPDGRFVIAFDRDAGPTAELVATLGNGTQRRETLTIAKRAWDISRLDTLPKVPVPQAQYDKVRPGEVALINAARGMQTDAQGWKQSFLWPVTGRISTLFGSQRIYKNGEAGSYHSGVDIARPTGTVVLAPADGVVILAADHPFTLEGNLLMIDHGMGLNSAFMHLSRIDVKLGAHVKRGQPIGLVGMSGRATGPHLHWGMKWRDSRIDPLLIAGPMPVAD